jgi:hypothetical protein
MKIEWKLESKKRMSSWIPWHKDYILNIINGILYSYSRNDNCFYAIKTDLPSKPIQAAAKIEPWDPPLRVVWPPKIYYFYWFLLILVGLYLITAIFRMTYAGGKLVYKRAIKKKKA